MSDDGQIEAHAATYSSLIALLKWGAVTVFVVAAIVIWLIAPAGK